MTMGGAERQFMHLMMQLDRARYRPLLICLNLTGEFYEQALELGVECHFLNIDRNGRLRGLLGLAHLFRSRDVRVALMRGFSATTLGRVAALLAGVPIRIVTEHSTGWVAQPAWWKRGIDALLLPFTTRFVAVAEAQVPFLTKSKGIPAAKISVIRNGIDPIESPPGSRERSRAVLGLSAKSIAIGIVAVLRPEKDHRTFLEAAALLAARAPDVRFVIIGDGPLSASIASWVAELGLEDIALLTGGRSDVEALLPGIDVFTISSYTEAFPMAVLEAMSCGIPIVATAVGGLPEMIDDGVEGILVPPRSPRKLAEAWYELVTDPRRRKSMGQRAAIRVRREFTAGEMARRYEALFEELMGA
jgi:glycosyltransferase involved in cell wall biosynthesis